MGEVSIRGPDGRVLRVCEEGDLAGVPIVYHHGTPGDRSLHRPWVEDATRTGIRLIGYDRPGYGGSERHEGRRVSDAAADVTAIADALEIDRLASWGVSGGGPHVLACAALLGERLVAAAALASVAPRDAQGLDWLAGMGDDNVREFQAALTGPGALQPLLNEWREDALAAEPETLHGQLESLLSPADASVLTGQTAAFLHASFGNGLVRGVDGWLDDDLAFVAPWGFGLADIAIPVTLWQGGQDLFVPPAHGRWLSERIPGVDAHLPFEDGHLTLSERRVPEIHAWLKARF